MGQIHNTTAAHDRPNVGRANGRLRDRIIARGATRHERTNQPNHRPTNQQSIKIDYFVMDALSQIRRSSVRHQKSIRPSGKCWRGREGGLLL